MTDKLQSRAVFIDTSVFVSQNFTFEGRLFASLADFCQAGIIQLVLTEITCRELEAQLEEKVDQAARALEKASSKASILRPLERDGLHELFSPVDKSAYLDNLKKRLHKFLEDTGCEIVGVDAVQVGPVFDLYFEKRPPFVDGKKAEFPDAFALAALRTWCEENNQKIYVISQDSDMQAVCGEPGPLRYVEELSEFLELVLKDRGAATEAAHFRFSKVRAEVLEKAEAEFKDLYMFLIDQDGEVLRVEIEDVQLREESVVSLFQETADYMLSAEFLFKAEITYPDPNYVFHNKEMGAYIYFASVEETVRRGLEVPVEVSIWFDPNDLEANHVAQVVLNNGDSLVIQAEEDE